MLSWCSAIIPFNAGAQLHNSIDQLDTSFISTNFLYPHSYVLFQVPDPNSFDDTLNSRLSADLFNAFGNSQADSSLFYDQLHKMDTQMIEKHDEYGSIALAILDVVYNDFAHSALTDSLLFRIGNKFYDNPATLVSPYVGKGCIDIMGPCRLNKTGHMGMM